MQKECIYIKCWNEKGNYVGVLAVYSAKEMERYAMTYPRYEYIS